jgi:N-acetylneuraminic acid mutarotase
MKVQRLLFIVTLSVGLFSCGSTTNNNNGDWVTMSVFSGQNRIGAVAFSLNDTGYVGTGFDGINYYDDFWAYDPVGNTWTAVDTMPGPPRSLAVAFATSNYGYVGQGWNGMGLTIGGTLEYYLNDFYRFSSATGWSTIPSPPIPQTSPGRKEATAFGIGAPYNIGGVLGGFDGQFVWKDYYEWNESEGIWDPNNNNTYPGPKRYGAVTFVYNNKAYVITGLGDNGIALTDFWRYNPAKSSNKWDDSLRRISGVVDQSYDAGYRIIRTNAVAWVQNNANIPKAYVALGSYNGNLADCWEYDFTYDLWAQKNNFPGTARVGAVALTLNGRGFLGLGGSSVAAGSGGQFFSDWTQFYPDLPLNPDDYYSQ